MIYIDNIFTLAIHFVGYPCWEVAAGSYDLLAPLAARQVWDEKWSSEGPKGLKIPFMKRLREEQDCRLQVALHFANHLERSGPGVLWHQAVPDTFEPPHNPRRWESSWAWGKNSLVAPRRYVTINTSERWNGKEPTPDEIRERLLAQRVERRLPLREWLLDNPDEGPVVLDLFSIIAHHFPNTEVSI